MSEANKQIVRRLVDELWNQANYEVLEELMDPACDSHDSPYWAGGNVHGLEGHANGVRMYRHGMPDLRFEVEEQVAEGDLIVTRWSASGTHESELFGVPATGRRAAVAGIFIHRIKDGKIVEGWSAWDLFGLMQQLRGPGRPQVAAPA